jgi:hypothetical protein
VVSTKIGVAMVTRRSKMAANLSHKVVTYLYLGQIKKAILNKSRNPPELSSGWLSLFRPEGVGSYFSNIGLNSC